MAELAGRLNQAVLIQRWQPARDAAGNDGGTWVSLRRCHAEIRPDAALAAVTGGEAARSVRRWRVLLRDADDLGLAVRLRWRGQNLAVLAVGPDPGAPGWVNLLCEGRGP